MRPRRRSEDGAAAVEFALFLPMVMFLAMIATPIVRMVIDYTQLTHVTEAGARYATAAHMDPANPAVYRFRPDAAGVVTYMRQVSGLTLSSVTVSPDPASAFPGTQITVTVRYQASFGPLASAANALASLVHASPPFPGGGLTLTSTATMREE